jgi:hypothetical protein
MNIGYLKSALLQRKISESATQIISSCPKVLEQPNFS